MITDDEVLRLFERADPARTGDATPAIDAAGYLDALRTRSSTVDYIDTEPASTEPPTNRRRWLAAAGAAAAVAVIVGGLVLAARPDDRTGVPSDTGAVTEQPPVTEQPVTTPPAGATTPAVEDAATRIGFVGLPPEGATPSTPEGGEMVVWIYACGTPAEPGGRIGDPSEIDTFPLLGQLLVLADGRLIWQKYEDLPEGANRLSTGLLEQRLTPEGVELMRSEAAEFAGEPLHCLPGSHDMLFASPDDDSESKTISVDNEHSARLLDPWSWLPATAWEDREIRAYVPTKYLVTILTEDPIDIEPDQLTALLPAAAADLIEAKPNDGQGFNVTFTTDEARALAAALDDAGLARDGLLNLYQLDYQFDYQEGSRDTVAHITFSVGCVGEVAVVPIRDGCAA